VDSVFFSKTKQCAFKKQSNFVLTIGLYLGDNCSVFENFTASIGDLMVAN
jgi:hypothetical protein